MASSQPQARWAGILFLLQLIPYFIAHDQILGALLGAEDMLEKIFAHKTQVAWALVLELLSAVSFMGFTLILLPFFRKVNDVFALGYLGFRFAEFTLIAFSQVKLAALLETSKHYVQAASGQEVLYQVMGHTLYEEWVWTSLIHMLIFCANAGLFYYLLYHSHIVPRFIAVWGFLGGVLGLLGPLCILFGIKGGGMWLYLPIGLNELFLALWLLLKGFRPAAVESK